MARRWNGLDRIFSAGIVWDPDEPLPHELQDAVHSYHVAGRSNVDFQYFQLPGQHPEGVVHRHHDLLPIQQPVKGAATWPVAGDAPGRKLPSFTVQQHGRHLLPPLSVTVDASIVQDTARVSVTQLFWNDSGNPIKEAAFTFPLPAGCTVTDFSCRIGTNKILRGAVKPREEARNAFKNHIRTHETAAGLLEQDTPEIFTTTLGNVPEKTKVKVSLTYIAVLKHRFADSRNVATLTLPTSIAPRFGEAPEEYNDAASTNVSQGLTLDIEIVESENITSVDSPSHAITVARRRGARDAESFADLAGEGDRSTVETASVKLETGNMFLDKDFVLDIVTAPDGGNENPQAWLEEHPTFPNHKTLMLTLPPGFLARNAPPMQRSEILFLADRSGSMKDKIVALKSAMQFFLKGIPEGRKFNIWSFGSQYTSWAPQSVEYTEQTLNSALSWVASDLNANMGGTELLPAIQAIVDARDRALMTDVIILTDGQTWRMEQTLDYIQKTHGLTEGRVRFFALGIGRAVSHALVDGIAKAGGGYAEVVQEASQGGWEDRVVSMAKAALMSAHLGPLHLTFNVQDENGASRSSTLADAKRSPADTSAVSPFDRSRLYFHLDRLNEAESIKSVQVEVQANDETTTLVIPVTVLEKRDTTLHKLAARSMLDDLERGRSHIHLGPNRPVPGSLGETNMVRKEAEGLACKWSLVSKWTSFFLAEEPYIPTGEDAFMDGVVKVKVSPADDLLQPRGTVQHIAALEPAGLDDPDLEMRIRAITRPWEASPVVTYSHNSSDSRYRMESVMGSVRGDSTVSYPIRKLPPAHAMAAPPSRPSQASRPVRGWVKSLPPPGGDTCYFNPLNSSAAAPSETRPTFIPPPPPPSRALQASGFGAAYPGTHGSYYPNSSPAMPMMSRNQEISGVPTDPFTGRAQHSTRTAEPREPGGRDRDRTDRQRLRERFERGDRSIGAHEPAPFDLPLDSATLLGRRKSTDPAVPPTVVDSLTFPAYRAAAAEFNTFSANDSANPLNSTEEVSRQASRETVQPPASEGQTYTPPFPTYGEGVGIPSHEEMGDNYLALPWTAAFGDPMAPSSPEADEDSFDFDMTAAFGTAMAPKSPEADDGDRPRRFHCRAPAPDDKFVRRESESRSRSKSPGLLMYLAGVRPRSEDRHRDPNGDVDLPQSATHGDTDMDTEGISRDGEPRTASSSRFDTVDTSSTAAQPQSDTDDTLPEAGEGEGSSPNSHGSRRRWRRRAQPDIIKPYNTTATKGISPSNPQQPNDPKGRSKPPSERDFRTLLGYQHFDGSIDFGDWATAETVLGKAITDVLRAVERSHPDGEAKTLWTAAVHVLLERDFQSSKSLWELMAVKMELYCHGRRLVSAFGLDPLVVVKRELEGLKLPVHQHQEETKSHSEEAATAAEHKRLWERLRMPRRSDRDEDEQPDEKELGGRSKGSKMESVVDDADGREDVLPGESNTVVVGAEVDEDALREESGAGPATPVV